MSDIVHWLRKLAALVEADHAPQHVVMHMRAGADEIERLRAGGCARDQGTTQFCAEAARLADENDKLRAALGLFACDCIESGNLCPSPQNCRNYIARAALEGL